MKIKTNVYSTQAYGYLLCIQIGSVAFLIGKRKNKSCGCRIELFTPAKIFRIS
jgi:hypothetical protein